MGFIGCLPFRRAPPPRPHSHVSVPLQSLFPFRGAPVCFVSGIGFYYVFIYGYWLYQLSGEPSHPPIVDGSDGSPSDPDTSLRYDDLASTFDDEVDTTETLSGINTLRKRLVGQASGHILEASVGTGRNAKYYNLKECKSITFLDQSGPMLEIARQKWKELYPNGPTDTKVAFRQESASEFRVAPKEGYDTIVQTMGACSTPRPVETLRHLGGLLNPRTGRLLLIEHGRGHYDWVNFILDRSARGHGEQFGCYHNRDIGEIVRQSGLVVQKIERPRWWNLGTVWVVEARPHGWKDTTIHGRKDTRIQTYGAQQRRAV